MPNPPQPERPARRSRWGALIIGAGLLLAGVVTAPAHAEPPAAPKAATTHGTWTVRPLGVDHFQVSWTSPDRFPISSDRPTITGRSGLVFGPSTVARDGRTVRTVVAATDAPKPDQLDVVLSGRRLDEVQKALALPDEAEASDPAGVARLANDPGTPGPYAVVTSDYTRTPVPVAGMDQPIEMVGHVVEPAPGAATGPRPLVFLLHGRHDYCYQAGAGAVNEDWPCRGAMKEVPSQLGYDYLQRLLASQGYTTVSVRVNGINAQDYALEDGGAAARATIVAKHLDYWTSIAKAHKVDLRRVVLVGHSRGGEGVDRASIRIPRSAPYRIVGQVLIAPTDFGSQTAPYVPTVTLLPYCDGDVSDLQGQQFTDVGRDLTTDDRALKSSVLIMGANHNFFNTEWTPGLSVAPSNDDWFGPAKAACGTRTAARLTAGQQRAVAKAYVAGAVRLFAAPQGAGRDFLPLFDGSRVGVPSAGKAVVRTHAILGGRDLRTPAAGTAVVPGGGGTSRFCTGATTYETDADACGSKLVNYVTPHWPELGNPAPVRKFWDFSWKRPGATAGLQLSRPLDLRGRSLDLRTIVDPGPGSVRLKVRLTDAGGRSATLVPVGGAKVPALLKVQFATKLWAQAVRVDPAGAAGPGGTPLDLARIVRVDLVGETVDGHVWVADLAAHTDRLPALTGQRMPALSIGRARVVEGNRVGRQTAEVPFRLSAPMVRAGQLVVVTASDQTGEPVRSVVNLARGQKTGTIPVGYDSNTLDDQPGETSTYLSGWAVRNVMTDVYTGALVVVDDDPTPAVTVTALAPVVKEGESARWRVNLDRPVNYPVEIFAPVVRGPGRNLTGRDVPASWLTGHAEPGHRSRALYRLHASAYEDLEPGAVSTVVSIPIRKDKKDEEEEALTLQFEVLGTTSIQTVKVAPSP